MAEKQVLKVDNRKTVGRKVKKLRRDGLLPANISGKGVKSLSVQLSVKEFKTIFAKVGETSILELQVAKETKTRPALIHSVQIHPVTEEVLHVDFRQVDLTQKVTVAIPLEVTGLAPAIAQGGVLIQLLNQIDVEALPKDLPEKLMVDVSHLENMGQSLSLKDLKVDTAKVKILTENLDEMVVKIEEPTKEEVVPEPVAETVPTEGEAAASAGEEKKPEEKKDEKPKAEKK